MAITITRIRGVNSAVGEPGLAARALARSRKRWRAWLRALHRDAGYLAVGLTFVYALSGIAINHIDDWNPNFDVVSRRVILKQPLPTDEAGATRVVLQALGIEETPEDAYFATDDEFDVELTGSNHTVRVDVPAGIIYEDYEKPRFLLRVANWLHYNRGKAAWTYIADGFAVFLLFLAISGMFMLKGRKGIIGRGAALVLLGAAVPILYVHFAGGP